MREYSYLLPCSFCDCCAGSCVEGGGRKSDGNREEEESVMRWDGAMLTPHVTTQFLSLPSLRHVRLRLHRHRGAMRQHRAGRATDHRRGVQQYL